MKSVRSSFLSTIVLTVTLIITATFSAMAAETVEAPAYSAIEPGSTGEPVSNLQARLKELGYYDLDIDGSYGEGMTGAITTFQMVNEITSDGIASEETVKAIYSEDAIPMPPLPEVFVSEIFYEDDAGYVAVINTSDKAIDSVSVGIINYDSAGNIYLPDPKSIENSFWDIVETEYYIELGNNEYGVIEFDNTDTEIAGKITDLGAYVTGYHTVDGESCEYFPDQFMILSTNEKFVFPKEQPVPDIMTDAEIEESYSMSIGIDIGVIYPWFAEVFDVPAGTYISSVSKGSIFDFAGFDAGGVITKIGDGDFANSHALMKAKLQLLNGETVPVTYYINNEEKIIPIAMDMETADTNEINDAAETNPEETTTAASSISEELSNLADLYNQGLLSDEEYEAAKKKILE